VKTIYKNLSPNDLGLTGGHQSGILVPKRLLDEVSFFPALSAREKNPRVKLTFQLRNSDESLLLNFIYYNSKFFGGTRNEYRLTGLGPYLRRIGASPGDNIKMSESHGKLYLEHEAQEISAAPRRLFLSGEWGINER
jgi:hypothetical protein